MRMALERDCRHHCAYASLAMLLVAAGCEGAASRPKASGSPPADSTGQAATPNNARSAILTFDSMPPGARAALAAQAPDFQPWSIDSFPSADVRANASPDAGLNIVRAHFRSPSSVDYVLIGYDRRWRARQIVAVLAEPGGVFKVSGVTDGPERPDSLLARPNGFLAVDTTAVAGKVDLLDVQLGGTPPINGHRYRWVASRGQFLSVEPIN